MKITKLLLLLTTLTLTTAQNYSLEFDPSDAGFGGQDDFLRLNDVSSNPNFTQLSSGYTFEMWVNLDTHWWSGQSNHQTMFISGIISGRFTITSENKLHWAFNDETGNSYSLDSDYEFPLNEWHHLAICYENNHASLWDNGILVAETDTESDLSLGWTPGNGFSVGIAYWSNGWWYYLDGEIDDLRISNIARYEDEFTPTAFNTSDENTVVFWPFNEGN